MNSQKFDVTQEQVEELQFFASIGQMLLIYNDGHSASKLSCDNDDDRGAMLGTFLVAAGKHSYFNCGPNCDNNRLYPEMTLPLGPPLGEAQLIGGILMRNFTHGAVAKFRAGAQRTDRGEACVVWGDGSVSGKCPEARSRSVLV